MGALFISVVLLNIVRNDFAITYDSVGPSVWAWLL